jgi:hypothetical protein
MSAMKASGVTQVIFSVIALIFVLPGIDALRQGIGKASTCCWPGA